MNGTIKNMQYAVSITTIMIIWLYSKISCNIISQVIIQVLILFIPAVVILLIYSGLYYTSLISFAFSFILIFLVVILPVKSLDKDDIITIYQMYNLSGGQKQRTAIARTLVNDPKIILADESTGTLDSKNASLIMYVFKEFNNSGKTIILVTHDNDVAKVCKNSLWKLTHGMRQRLGIAQAIMENPDILILDEPMNGFYNDGVNDIRKLFLVAEFKKLP